MNPNQQPAQPPAPLNTGQYDFITNPAPPPKQPRMNFGGGLSGKLKIFGIGLGVFIVVFLLYTLIFGGGGGDSEVLLSTAQKQNQLIALSEVGTDKAGSTKAQSEAYNSLLTVKTQLNETVNIIIKDGKKLKAKDILLPISGTNQKDLVQAETNGRFDDVFLNILEKELVAYQGQLKKDHGLLKSEKAKQTLSSAYDDIGLLISSINQ